MRRFFLSLSCCLLLGCSSNPVQEETTETSQIETTETKMETTTVEDSFEPVYQVVYTLPDTYLYEDPLCQQEVKQSEPFTSYYTDGKQDGVFRVESGYLREKDVLTSLLDYPWNFQIQGVPGNESIIGVFRGVEQIPSIWESFQKQGWTLYVTDQDIQSKYSDYTYAIGGITDYETKEIWIGNYGEETTSQVLHEMGHYLDWSLDFPSNSDTFLAIHQKEKSQMFYIAEVLRDHIEDPREYFAESVCQFVENKERLKQYNPETYQYFSQIL